MKDLRLLKIIGLGMLMLILSACKAPPDDPPAEGAFKADIQLDWVPEPEFGGYYAARDSGLFSQEHLEVHLKPGGPGVPTLQLIESGQVTFGITTADNILIARDRGADLVALFALYQTFPAGIMVHAERGLHGLEDVFKEGTLAMEPGTPTFKFLEKRFGFHHIHVVPYTNNLSPFLHDPQLAQQCYVTAEPIAARRAGASPFVFPISDAGYNPYSGILVTKREVLIKHKDEVRRLIRAIKAGWTAYLKDPTSANQAMHQLNPTMDEATFEASSKIQAPLIVGSPGTPIGQMTLERWQTLSGQLVELGLIQPSDPQSAFEPSE
ncbi:MAG: ABC transporter substrate-binding protein [Methylococcus sp.]|jgi:NitT/TauT family transport system substrate-binding protein|nr:MAG: ABC transporter substrate-binding protein [Methylococcus sp.]